MENFDFTGFSGDDLITSAGDIARLYGFEDESRLNLALFKHTDCGMCASWDKDKIMLTGYIECRDAGHPHETLNFPFTLKKYMEAINRIGDVAK